MKAGVAPEVAVVTADSMSWPTAFCVAVGIVCLTVLLFKMLSGWD